MGIVILAPTYLGTRQLNLRAKRDVKSPADLAGVKLRMPGGPEWLLLGESLGVTPTPMAHAGGLSVAQDRRDRRPGKPAHHHERRQVLRGDRSRWC